MAKALFGHVGVSADPRLIAEVRRLRTRVQELERELVRLQSANDVLSATVAVVDGVSAHADEFDTSGLLEPALT